MLVLLREWGDTLRELRASMEGDKNVNKKLHTLDIYYRDSFQSKLYFCILQEVNRDAVMSISLQPHSALANANVPAEAKEWQTEDIQPLAESH